MKHLKNRYVQTSFSSYDVKRRSLKSSTFYNQLNILVDWAQIEKVINRYYQKGETLSGAKPYSALLLSKMLLPGIRNNLSDVQVETHVNDSLSAGRFCGLSLEDSVPDHSSLKGKISYEIAEDRHEDAVPAEEEGKQTTSLKKQQGKGVDIEGRPLKKNGRSIFGFKRHDAVDDNGLILAVHTTTANEHDSKGLAPLLEKLPKEKLKGGALADKGYQAPSSNALLKEKSIKNRLMHKAYRNRPLTRRQKVFNKQISKSRWVVERTFGSIKKWFKGGTARYMGLQKTHTQHVLPAIAYHLKRSPGIVMSNSLK
ncbi:MAG: transposase [Tannerellaceae bacterium]|jgi:IS5 family transposase|nr:transposase [Tannerellaceae bacterium]